MISRRGLLVGVAGLAVAHASVAEQAAPCPVGATTHPWVVGSRTRPAGQAQALPATTSPAGHGRQA